MYRIIFYCIILTFFNCTPDKEQVLLKTDITQTFNLGEKSENIETKNNTATVFFDNRLQVTIKSNHLNDQATIHDFYRSVSPYQLSDTKQIKIQSNNNVITTIIVLNSDEYGNPVSNVSVTNGQIYYTKEKHTHKINM